MEVDHIHFQSYKAKGLSINAVCHKIRRFRCIKRKNFCSHRRCGARSSAWRPCETDRRDAEQLARLFRAGELTAVHVPSRDDEALRDLVRCREAAKEDAHRARQRMLKFLLRHQIHPPETIKRRWTKKYREWLASLTFEHEAMQIVFREMLHALEEVEQRMSRLENALLEQAMTGAKASLIQLLQSLRGVGRLTAITIAAEIGTLHGFAHLRSSWHTWVLCRGAGWKACLLTYSSYLGKRRNACIRSTAD